MLISLGFFRRKPGLTREEFFHHWEEVHGPRYQQIPGVSNYIKRYVQHHCTPTGAPNVGDLEYDGFSETWFVSAEARNAMYALPFVQNELIAGISEFVDVNATRVLMIDRQVVHVGKDYTAEWMGAPGTAFI